MATDYYLKIDGIQGESTDKQHPGEIQLESWSFGATNPTIPAPVGGSGAGRPAIVALGSSSQLLYRPAGGTACDQALTLAEAAQWALEHPQFDLRRLP